MREQELFERLRAPGGWKVVEEWLRDREPESVHLEFKPKKSGSPGSPLRQLSIEDKSDLARALSGFANTEGGLYVIGVCTDRGQTKDEPDTASRVEEIPEVAALAGYLDRELRNFTEPIVAGLRSTAVLNPSKPGQGILAVFLPQSSGGPHRAVRANDSVNHKYFMRTATSTTPMPHALLEDAFGRRPQPQLRMVALLHAWSGTVQRLELFLQNFGRGTARSPAVFCRLGDLRFHGQPAHCRTNWYVLDSAPSVAEVHLASQDGAYVFPG